MCILCLTPDERIGVLSISMLCGALRSNQKSWTCQDLALFLFSEDNLGSGDTLIALDHV